MYQRLILIFFSKNQRDRKREKKKEHNDNLYRKRKQIIHLNSLWCGVDRYYEEFPHISLSTLLSPLLGHVTPDFLRRYIYIPPQLSRLEIFPGKPD